MRIDQERNGRINADDVRQFLLQNKLEYEIEDVKKLMKEHDKDKDGTWCEEEFLNAIYPLSSASHRRVQKCGIRPKLNG